jgi:hypothetical protein
MKFLVSLCVLVLAGCGGHGPGDIDEVVGAACDSDRECDARCYQGGDFPGGFCSLPCETDNDCPGDTYCIRESDGVCMYACPAFDCRRLGPGWGCRDKERESGGHVSVCAGN